MKKLFAVLTAVLVLAACQVPFSGTGSLSIHIPAVSKALVNDGKGDLVRIQLVRDGRVVPLSGRDFLEQTLAGQTVNLDGLPTGTGYAVNVATGSWNAAHDYFEVGYFSSSQPFELTAGVSTEVPVTLSTTPVRLLNSGAFAHSAVVVDGALKVLGADAGTAKLLTYTSESVVERSYTPEVADVQSLGRSLNYQGTPGVYLNTKKGLVVAESGVTTMVDSDGKALTPNVDFSGSFQVTSDEKTYTLNVYAGPGLNGGLYVVNSDTADKAVKWVDFQSQIPSNLQDKVKKVERLIRDFATTPDFSYISTALGTYRVDADMLTNKNADDLSQTFMNAKAGDGIKLVALLGENTQSIGPVSAYDSGNSTEGGLVFAGTSKGLFSAPTGYREGPEDTTDAVKPTGLPTRDLTLVSGTYGLDIRTLATYEKAVNNAVYTAAYSANTKEVLILKGEGTIVGRYPVLSGLPSGKLSLVWWPNDNALKLVVSGDTGTVVLTVAQ